MKRAIVFVAALAASCTDAEYSQLSALGESANLTCYSGTAVLGQVMPQPIIYLDEVERR